MIGLNYFGLFPYRALFLKLETDELGYDQGYTYLDVNNMTDLHVLQYLILKRTSESIIDWIQMWNLHRLSPDRLYADHPLNYARRDLLGVIADNVEAYSFFCGDSDDEGDDEEFESVRVSDALWQLGEDKQHFRPLTLENDFTSAKEYIKAQLNLFIVCRCT